MCLNPDTIGMSPAVTREEKYDLTIVLFKPRWQFCFTFADKSNERSKKIKLIPLDSQSS